MKHRLSNVDLRKECLDEINEVFDDLNESEVRALFKGLNLTQLNGVREQIGKLTSKINSLQVKIDQFENE